MPLTDCPDCGKSISDSAPACPNCGRPNSSTIEASKPAIAPPVSQTGRPPRKIGKLGGCLLVILGLAAIGEISSYFGPGARTPEPPTEAVAQAAADSADFDKLSFESKPLTSDLDQDGRQHFLLIVTNMSHRTFVGSVVVRALDAAGRKVDSDILGPATIPADGGDVRATTWFEKPFAIRKFDMSPSGTFQTLAPISATVPFEELSVSHGSNVFIYTASRDSAALWKIAQAYKGRYAAQNVLAIEFFHDRKRAARRFPMSDAALSVLTGAYEFNRTSGFEQLHIVR